MIQRLSHTTLFVQDQDVAKKFYVDTLGFEVRMDSTMDNGFRWLTVAPKGQDLEIVLMKAGPSPFMDQETIDAFQLLQKKGVLGGGVFQTPDCQTTYQELKQKGVEFTSGPEDRFYGVEALFKDGQGNWFSLTQPKDFQK